jgi:dihydroneopterin aldolase
MSDTARVQPFRLADAERSLRHVFVRDLVLQAFIGIHRHERRGPQPVRINIDLTVDDDRAIEDRLEQVVDYETLVAAVKTLVASGHINLVETLAERIATISLSDHRVAAARVRVEKLNVVAEAVSVGVEIERLRPKR